MAVPVHRMGDTNSAGGAVTSIPQSTVYANGLLVVVNGSLGTSHDPFEIPHIAGTWNTANGGPTVLVEGIPANGTGDADSCGHPRASGSPDVFIAD